MNLLHGRTPNLCVGATLIVAWTHTRTILFSYKCLLFIKMDTFNPKNLTLHKKLSGDTNNDQAPPRHKPGENFLKGPIPWQWLSIAAKQQGKALHVALAIWFLVGIARKKTVTLQGKVLRTLGVNRHALYRALRALERVKLVSVERRSGRYPDITVNNIPNANLDSKN